MTPAVRTPFRPKWSPPSGHVARRRVSPVSPRRSSKAPAACSAPGADLKSLSEALAKPPPPGETDPLQALNVAGGRFFARFAALPFVTIAVVDGAAVGGGMGLAAAADIVIATGRARFALAETSLGLPPAQIAPYLVARLGERVARRLALTGARVEGREAEALGLADFFCEGEAERDAKLESRFCGDRALCARRQRGDQAPFRACRALSPEAYIETAARSFAEALRGPEGREGLAAFVEKRAPFLGETNGMSRRFSSVLVANRGEIACRIIRAARARRPPHGRRLSATRDAEALHVRLADAAVRIGPLDLQESYLSIGKLIAAAKASAPRRFTPATASSPKAPRSPKPASPRASSSSGRRRRRFAPWATRPQPRS